MASNNLLSSQSVPLAGVVTNPKTQQMSDNTPTTVLMNRQGDMLVSQYHGKYGSAAARGAVFMGAVTTVGTLIPTIIVTAAAHTFALVNPTGSGVYMEPCHFQLDFLLTNAAPATATVVGFEFINFATNAFVSSTKAPVPTGGLGLGAIGGFPTRMDAAAPVGHLATVLTVTSSTSVAANWGYPMFTFPASWVPTVGGYPVPLVHQFDGKIMLPPGYAMTLASSTVWGANTVVPSISWVEHLI